jgi:hypothetical protein
LPVSPTEDPQHAANSTRKRVAQSVAAKAAKCPKHEELGGRVRALLGSDTRFMHGIKTIPPWKVCQCDEHKKSRQVAYACRGWVRNEDGQRELSGDGFCKVCARCAKAAAKPMARGSGAYSTRGALDPDRNTCKACKPWQMDCKCHQYDDNPPWPDCVPACQPRAGAAA